MKKWMTFVLTLVCELGLAGCGRSMNDVIGKEPDFAGIVQLVMDDYIVVNVNEDEVVYENYPVLMVSLNVEIKDSYLDYSVGDEVVVYYDGNITDGEPTTVDTVYALTLRTPANREAEKWDLIPMVIVDGELYLDTGRESTVEGRCGLMDGEITSTVESWEKPTEDDQSNFGTGYGYQYGTAGTIEIYINEKWWVFVSEEAR